jgi:opacity protein-like surface antigen
MELKISVLLALTCFVLPSAFAQNFEIGAQIGGQLNGGVNLSTTLFHRVDVQHSLNYGVTAGYLLEYFGAEFQWNRTSAATLAEPNTGGPGVKLFTLNQNQYMGNFLIHFKSREARMRPFAFFGRGASTLSPSVTGVSGSTRFAFSVGAGAKYKLTPRFGLRGQIRYTPVYLTTTSNGGYWCDPFCRREHLQSRDQVLSRAFKGWLACKKFSIHIFLFSNLMWTNSVVWARVRRVEPGLLRGARKSHVAPLVERHTRFCMLVTVLGKNTATVVAALSQHVWELPVTLRRSLIWDRGLEMAQHKKFTLATDVQVLLLRSAKLLAARLERKHERPLCVWINAHERRWDFKPGG